MRTTTLLEVRQMTPRLSLYSLAAYSLGVIVGATCAYILAAGGPAWVAFGVSPFGIAMVWQYFKAMRIAALALVVAALSISQAQARCYGGPHDPLTPQNPRCDVSQFLNPSMTSMGFWTTSPTARQSMVADCTRTWAPYPGWRRPPASWCSAAFQAQRYSR